MSDYDVIIAGGGHNALICAALLVRNGLKVLVAERNDWVGGGVVTREVTCPVINMTCSALPMSGFT